MATDLRIVLPNRPGALINACEVVSGAGVAIGGVCGDLRPGETWGFLHVLVEDADVARRALEDAGLQISSEHEVDVMEVDPHPGALVETFRRYSDAGDNIEVAYLATSTRLVVGTESMRKPITGVRIGDTDPAR